MKYAVLILRYIKGYVTFEAKGGFFERFFNLCALRKINLWNVKKNEDKLYASVSISEFKRLREPARKSGVKITLLNKTGLIYVFRKHRKRIALVYGLLFFLIFHIIMNQFVWSIDVNGNNKISKSELMNKACEQGLSYSTNIRTFDEIKASRNIAAEYEGRIPWLSINIKGSLAVIELRENSDSDKKIKDTSPCNIVAAFDGIIISTEVFKGDLMTSVGNGVRKGDLLISGAIVNEDMSTTFYHADGKIAALHDESNKLKLHNDKEIFRLTEEKRRTYYNFLNIKIPYKFRRNSKEIILNDVYQMNINGYNLPFGYIKESEVSEHKTIDEHAVNMISTENVMNELYMKYSNSTVIAKSERISFSENSLFYIGDYTLIDFIGEEKPILSQKIK